MQRSRNKKPSTVRRIEAGTHGEPVIQGEAGTQLGPHHWPKRTGRREPSPRALIGLCLAMGLCSFSKVSHAVAVTVEVASDVEELVDAPLARRLIRLELADVELPKVNGATPTRPVLTTTQRLDEVVFVRLLRQGDGLLVELWAKGELYGERRLVFSSNEQHQARRVALASAELARGLREARVRERQRLLREHLAPNPITTPDYVTKVNVAGLATVAAGVWPGADTMLVGPRLFLNAVTESGVGVGITGAVLTSTAASVVRSWTELGFRSSWRHVLSRHLELAVGLDVAAGVVDIAPNASFDGSEVSQQTWQAKAGLDAHLEWRIEPQVSLVVAPEAGLFLRELRVVREGTSETLEGPWVGVALGVLAYL